MQTQHSEASSSQPNIRRAFSTPRLFKKLHTRRPPDVAALVSSPSSTADSSGDEAVWFKPKGRAQFDCNICFDAARDPVVTQCGHLYCWACIHQVCSFTVTCLIISGFRLLQFRLIRLVRLASLAAKFRP